jgi:hypothetical protein
MNGIFYVAVGDKFRAEALKSVTSLKQHLPHIHTTLFSDQPCGAGLFDRNIIIPNPKMTNQDKVECFQQVDYEKAVFLDTDTYVAGDISDLFELLDHFDFAAMIDPMRGYWYREWSLPDGFPEVNSGVVAFLNSIKAKKLFADWLVYYQESKAWQLRYWRKNDRFWDQPGLRRALFLAKDIRMAVLPSEYNALRFNGSYLWGKAKIVHGRGNIAAVAERMNRNLNLERAYFQGMGVIADFNRVSFKQVLETVFRVNACALLNVRDRIIKMVKRCFQSGRGKN